LNYNETSDGGHYFSVAFIENTSLKLTVIEINRIIYEGYNQI